MQSSLASVRGSVCYREASRPVLHAKFGDMARGVAELYTFPRLPNLLRASSQLYHFVPQKVIAVSYIIKLACSGSATGYHGEEEKPSHSFYRSGIRAVSV
ncbi:MAG: hypothetical protein M1423_01200 [Acidobacteria bacterium]|nr:hypothetical protein [Acidobacteriota bacterium]